METLAGIEIKQATYENIRAEIKTGDALVFAGLTPLQKAICLWGKPNNSTIGLSHASLVIRPVKYESWRDRVLIVEATGSLGLHPAILSERLLKLHGRCFHISTNLTDAQRAKIEEIALIDASSGIPYDYGGCLYNVIGAAVTDASKYFCSEYVGKKWMDVDYIPQGTAPKPNDLPVIAPKPCIITEIIIHKES